MYVYKVTFRGFDNRPTEMLKYTRKDKLKKTSKLTKTCNSCRVCYILK